MVAVFGIVNHPILRSGNCVCRGGAGGADICEEEGQQQGWQGQPLHAQHNRGLLCYAGVINTGFRIFSSSIFSRLP